MHNIRAAKAKPSKPAKVGPEFEQDTVHLAPKRFVKPAQAPAVDMKLKQDDALQRHVQRMTLKKRQEEESQERQRRRQEQCRQRRQSTQQQARGTGGVNVPLQERKLGWQPPPPVASENDPDQRPAQKQQQ